MQFFLIHSASLLLMILTKMLFIVKLSLKNPPELSSEGFLNLFRYDIYEFSWLKQFGELFEVANEQINWLFNNNVN